MGEERKVMKEIKGIMEKMWEDQRRGMERLKRKMKVLEGMMEQFRRK